MMRLLLMFLRNFFKKDRIGYNPPPVDLSVPKYLPPTPPKKLPPWER